MGSPPQVSVILPVYNREASVARAIDSVLAQTYRPFEVIVIDDGSTDGTRRVLDRYGSQITLLEQRHRGVYPARNLGCRQARGELLAFLDSDDAWRPDRLARQVPLMRGEVALVFGDVLCVPGGRTTFRIAPPRRGPAAAAQFAWCNFVPTISVLVRRDALEEIGGFAETTDASADYLAWFRIAWRHEIDYVDAVVADYSVHAGGISQDLGHALETRIELFSGQLAAAEEREMRVVLRRLLFNQATSLVLATVRGRARSVAHPLRLAWRTAAMAAGVEAALWLASFAMNQVRVRTRRLFS